MFTDLINIFDFADPIVQLLSSPLTPGFYDSNSFASIRLFDEIKENMRILSWSKQSCDSLPQ